MRTIYMECTLNYMLHLKKVALVEGLLGNCIQKRINEDIAYIITTKTTNEKQGEEAMQND